MKNIYENFIKNYKEIKLLNDFSTEKLLIIQKELQTLLSNKKLPKNNFCIITTGSFGRHDASQESDMDFFIITEKQCGYINDITSDIANLIKKHVKKETGTTGTFGIDNISLLTDITTNIGGNHDTNQLLTRRILFLLEGQSLFNNNQFNNYKALLISKYLDATKGQYLDKYFLNDVIRYYRTITTDFQYKIGESNKSWGLRNIKLKYSRKILYFSGILSIIYTYIQSENNFDIKNNVLSEILSIPVMERIFHILQILNKNNQSDINQEIKTLFSLYNYFLEKISNSENRKELENITKKERKSSPIYEDLNDKNYKFNDCLYKIIDKILMEEKYLFIKKALIF